MVREKENRSGDQEVFLINNIPKEEAWRLYDALGEIGAIFRQPTKPEASRVLIEWGRQKEFSLAEVVTFFKSQLTPEATVQIQEKAQEANLNLLNDSDFLSALQMIIPEEVEEPLKLEIDEKLRRDLQEGISSLIANEVIEEIRRIEEGEISLGAWLSNPLAVLSVWRAKADEAMAGARRKKAISETASWFTDAAEEKSRRDGLVAFERSVQNSEEPFGKHVEEFCRKMGLLVPPKGSYERMRVLLMIEDRMAGLQTHSGEFTKQGEKLVREEVGMQAETTRNQMIVLYKSAAIESRKEVHGLLEREWAETLRHWSTLVLGTPGAVITGSPTGVLGIMIEAGSNAVAEHPKIVIPLGAGIMFFSIFSATALSQGMFLESLGSISLSSGVVTGVTAVGTMLGWGLTKWWAKRREQEEKQEEKKYAIIK